MTKIALIAVTATGIRLAQKLQTSWQTELPIFVPKSKMAAGLSIIPTGNFKQGMQQLFKQYEALICIMATGIVVRSIAEVVSDKRQDPAVIVLDEKGQHVISLLSGHVGGGNQLAREIAEMINGQAVITTATDVQDVTALDLIAQEIDGWYPDFKTNTKRINALLADHQKVGLLQREHWVKDTRGLTLLEEKDNIAPFAAVLLVSDRMEELTNEKVLQVVPRRYVLGIGARKGVPFEIIKEEYLNFCQQERIHPRSIKTIVSIDLKKEETGICQLAAWLEAPFETYSAEKLASAAKKYPQSAFVKQTTGIGNVSLAAADLASYGQVISERYAQRGVTFALGKDGK
ncbi:cobalt-precorrin 5A hydrolase [Enterococcus sp. AZ109]|uniref:cobalt-precorrin 5A hydrolase n=1 Tax=Enterococcus sp. AZ109 TaxID=2774634 RepID=UPI003F683E2F